MMSALYHNNSHKGNSRMTRSPPLDSAWKNKYNDHNRQEVRMSSRTSHGKNGATNPELPALTNAGAKHEQKTPTHALNRPERTLEQLWKEHETLAQELEARTKEHIL